MTDKLNTTYNLKIIGNLRGFPEGIQFKYAWRKYQKRVLDELKAHLADNHLHIIAPPGSGKTILGLEVALRLNKPTLIFAPTIAIRNQWVQRFRELFLQVDIDPDWISRDIKNPKFLTVSTYQGLHSACTGVDIDEDDFEEELTKSRSIEKSSNEKTEEIIAGLKSQGIGTIVVDEAHHLKNAWWKSLTAIKKGLKPTIVGLTATPPYDVTYAEWYRYTELNGPVDAEISVPELVVEGNLCPHQDYVFFSKPTRKEAEKIHDFRERIQILYEELKADVILIDAVERHPIIQDPNAHLDWIYVNLEYYSSALIFLKAVGKEVSLDHVGVIGDRRFVVPELNYEWMETLLSFYLYKDEVNFGKLTAHQEKIINKLKRNGAMERRSVRFSHNRRINNSLSSSISKLKSIDQIIDFEHDHLKQDLRLVVLTDFIRKEFLVNQSNNDLELNKIGVMPIFEQLRRTNGRNIKIGVLTGSLIIIPVSALELFKEVSIKNGVKSLSTKPLPYDDKYLIINSNEQIKHSIVHIVTQVFQQGEIEVLIGTKSLLGEGWDAPAINALILASFVGSYVLSNQMRGRAIRTEMENKNKTSNIWHLVCVDSTTHDGGDDVELLKRRFKAFVGVSFRDEATIENGIGRLEIPDSISSEKEILEANNTMFSQAGERSKLKEKWRLALESGTILLEEIKVPFSGSEDYGTVKSMHYRKTIKNLQRMLGSGLTAFAFEMLDGFARNARNFRTMQDVIYGVVIVAVIGVLIFGRLAFKTFKAYVKYRDIAKDIHQIGEALLQTLIKTELIHTKRELLKIVSNVDDDGAIYCHMKGGTTFEKSTFIKSLHEIIGPVENPRYVIIRNSFFLKVISQKDYHSVPDAIGRKRKNAEYFASMWLRFVGSATLVYTRTIEGRKLLLKSRINSLASEFQDPTERINKWR